MEAIFIGCNHRVQYHRARSGVTAINDGTCTYSLALDGGAEVTSGTVDYVTDSRGDYESVIDSADLADLTEGATYVLTIEFTLSGSAEPDDVRTIPYRATRRTFT